MKTAVCCASLVVLLLSGCGDQSSETEDKAIGADSSREELLAALIAKGDNFAAKGEKKRAAYAYEMAKQYHSDKTIDAKLESVQDGELSGMSQEELERMITVTKEFPLSFDDWPTATDDMERVDLRLLLDDRIGGALKIAALSANGKDIGVGCFLTKPKVSIDDVVSIYGKPALDKSDDEFRVITYGRLRLIEVRSDGFVAVFFQSKN